MASGGHRSVGRDKVASKVGRIPHDGVQRRVASGAVDQAQHVGADLHGLTQYRAKRADKVKLLFWDGTGVCLLIKRLEGAKFRWPAIQDGVMRLSPAQLSALLEGLDWARVHMRRVRAPQATQ